MLKKVAILLGLAGAIAYAVACSDDGGNGNSDGPVVLVDGGTDLPPGSETPITLPEGGTQDTGPTNLDCAGVAACIQQCSDQTCAAGCLAKGTPTAQSQYNAFTTCAQNSAQGSCASDCANLQSQQCVTCYNAACKSELDTCLGGGGPPEQGFGDPCPTPQCPTGFTCLTKQGEQKGFCSKACTNSGGLCTGGPTDTKPACIVQTSSGNMCAFLCKLGTETYTCPTGLTCSTTPDQPGSDQYSCVPQ